jgi:hypothetical protein
MHHLEHKQVCLGVTLSWICFTTYIYLFYIYAWKEETRLIGHLFLSAFIFFQHDLLMVFCVPGPGDVVLNEIEIQVWRLLQWKKRQTSLKWRNPRTTWTPDSSCWFLSMVPTVWIVFVWKAVLGSNGMIRVWKCCHPKPQSQLTPKHAYLCSGWGVRFWPDSLGFSWCIVSELHSSVLWNWVLSSKLWYFQGHVW